MIKWRDITDFVLTEAEVHIWLIDVGQHSPNIDKFFALLTQAEQERAKKFKFIEDHNCFVVSHAILRLILSAYLKCAPTKIKFSLNQYEKPELDNFDLHFNLSHTRNYALIAVNKTYAIGIDIEYMQRDNISYMDIAKRFFSQSEYNELKNLSAADKILGFYNAWTRKEAFIKAIGQGVAYNLSKFAVSLKPNEPAKIVTIDNNPIEAKKWQLESFTPIANYCGAVAWEGKPKKLQFYSCHKFCDH